MRPLPSARPRPLIGARASGPLRRPDLGPHPAPTWPRLRPPPGLLAGWLAASRLGASRRAASCEPRLASCRRGERRAEGPLGGRVWSRSRVLAPAACQRLGCWARRERIAPAARRPLGQVGGRAARSLARGGGGGGAQIDLACAQPNAKSRLSVHRTQWLMSH